MHRLTLATLLDNHAWTAAWPVNWHPHTSITMFGQVDPLVGDRVMAANERMEDQTPALIAITALVDRELQAMVEGIFA